MPLFASSEWEGLKQRSKSEDLPMPNHKVTVLSGEKLCSDRLRCINAAIPSVQSFSLTGEPSEN